MKRVKKMLALALVIITVLTMMVACKPKEANTPASPPASPSSPGSAPPSNPPGAPGTSTTPGNQTPAPPPAAPDVLATKTVRIGIAGNPATLDPWSLISEGRVDVLRNVYEFLFDIPYIGGAIVPVIASGFEQNDLLTYTVKLYDYVHDSKGNKITADDVVFSYESALALGFSGANLGSVDSIKKIDDYTIQFKLKSPAAGLIENALGYTAIVSKAEYEKNPDAFISNPVGTGPYVVTEHVPGSSLSFTRNDNYWQTDKSLVAKLSQANIGNIRYLVIPESSQLTMALESGNIDLGYFVSVSDLKRFEGKNFTTYTPPRDLADVILFNCLEGNVFTNQKLRQAVCYAIDSSVMVKVVYEGHGWVCKTYGSSVFTDYLEKWQNEEYYEYNPAKAKELLAEAGYPNGLTVTLLTANRETHVKMAQIIQTMLKDIGITVEIQQVDGAVFASYARNAQSEIPFDFYIDQRSSFDFVVNVWSFSFDANRNKGWTVNFYKDDQLQKLLLTATDSRTHTPDNIDKLHNYLKEICIGYAMCHGTYNFVAVDTITDFTRDFKSRLTPGGCTYSVDFVGG